MVKLPVPVSFEWDKGNFEKNWKKHKIHSKEAEEIFLNQPLVIFDDDKHSFVEKRFLGYGATHKKRKLTVVFTIRKDKIRIISVRDQNKKERRVYEQKTKNNSKV